MMKPTIGDCPLIEEFGCSVIAPGRLTRKYAPRVALSVEAAGVRVGGTTGLAIMALAVKTQCHDEVSNRDNHNRDSATYTLHHPKVLLASVL